MKVFIAYLSNLSNEPMLRTSCLEVLVFQIHSFVSDGMVTLEYDNYHK